MRRLQHALVLGGAGFLGRWLVAELHEAGLTTTIVDDLSGVASSTGQSDDLIIGDVRTLDLTALMSSRDIDVVFHLATAAYVPPSVEDPGADLQKNVATTISVFEAARRCPSPPLVVLASSAAVYGEAVYLPMNEDHPLRPVSPYGVSKLTAERYLEFYARVHSVRAIAIRLFSLYGPGQRKQVVYDLISRALSGENPLTVLGSPDASRDFVYVADAARGFVHLAQAAEAEGEVYNLAAGRPVRVADLASAVVESLGSRVTIVFPGQTRPGDPLHWHGDATAAESLGVRLDTPLEQGLRATADWVRAERGG